MRTHQPCRHCGSTSFYTASVQAGGSGGSLLPVGALHGPRYENVICGQCGHTEWFVSKEHLALVREKLTPVEAPANRDV
jgi:predicted nucleic-acid-binding Zn-ribbon protein